jgi:uncharacterized membrane protein YjgN (DUF898 family)
MSVDYLDPIERVATEAVARASGLIGPRFTSDGRSFFRLVLRGGLLQLVTAGFYRFWLLTNIRRRLWSATSFDGDALEYTGQGRELLIGFLFAVAILAPLSLAYFVLGLEIESFKAYASLPLSLFIYLFGQYAAYRARRYRLSRTVWRGVRFWMERDAWKYAVLSTGLFLRSVVTLWLTNPWRVAALERFKMRRTRYGDIQASFEGTGWGLLKSTLPLLFLGLLALLVIFVAMAKMSTVIQHSSLRPGVRGGVLDYLSFGLMFATAVTLWAAYQAVEWRWFVNGVRIGGASFQSTARTGRFVSLYFRFLGSAGAILVAVLGVLVLVVLSSLAFWVLSGRSPAALNDMLTHSRQQLIVSGLVGFAAIYLFALTLIGAAYRYFLQHQIWREIIDTMTVRGMESLSEAHTAGEAAGALGEGLLDSGLIDAFDIGAGF